MKKPEVLYAWERCFHKREVKKWINAQLARYGNEGYGYFAVTLKDTDRLIGQAGFFKSEVDGQKVVELGFIVCILGLKPSPLGETFRSTF